MVFTVLTTTFAESAVFLGTPHKDYPAYSLFRPQSQLTTNESIGAVHYLSLLLPYGCETCNQEPPERDSSAFSVLLTAVVHRMLRVQHL